MSVEAPDAGENVGVNVTPSTPPVDPKTPPNAMASADTTTTRMTAAIDARTVGRAAAPVVAGRPGAAASDGAREKAWPHDGQSPSAPVPARRDRRSCRTRSRSTDRPAPSIAPGHSAAAARTEGAVAACPKSGSGLVGTSGTSRTQARCQRPAFGDLSRWPRTAIRRAVRPSDRPRCDSDAKRINGCVHRTDGRRPDKSQLSGAR